MNISDIERDTGVNVGQNTQLLYFLLDSMLKRDINNCIENINLF